MKQRLNEKRYGFLKLIFIISFFLALVLAITSNLSATPDDKICSPSSEVCDGIDNDCDGAIDEGGVCNTECYNDFDCQEDYYDDKYCSYNAVYQDFHDFSCFNNECIDNVSSQIVEECNEQCINGECTGECSNDCDCEHDYDEDAYCIGNDVYRDLIDNFCSIEQTCEKNLIPVLFADCGEDEILDWQYYCDVNDVHRIREHVNRGCENNGCFSKSTFEDEFVKYCSLGCVNGECKDVACYENSDCGIDGFIGENYCKGDDVYRDYVNYQCISPGLDSSCKALTSSKLIESCKDECDSGKCKKDNEEDDDNKGFEEDYCGDGYCDNLEGENEDTCPFDCKAIKRTYNEQALKIGYLSSNQNLTSPGIIKLGARVLGVEESRYSYVPSVLLILILVILAIVILAVLFKG